MRHHRHIRMRLFKCLHRLWKIVQTRPHRKSNRHCTPVPRAEILPLLDGGLQLLADIPERLKELLSCRRHLRTAA